ncbi:protein transport protein Sec24C [Pelomyxa schiedti]|nr:protein transport protein Sec24C [Pelomyxa schiedti]
MSTNIKKRRYPAVGGDINTTASAASQSLSPSNLNASSTGTASHDITRPPAISRGEDSLPTRVAVSYAKNTAPIIAPRSVQPVPPMLVSSHSISSSVGTALSATTTTSAEPVELPVQATNTAIMPRCVAVHTNTANCSIKFMRMTVHEMPSNGVLASACAVPLAVIVTPLSEIGANEGIPFVDHGKDGPLRCNKCKGFINPFVKFCNDGHQYICSLCGMTNPVPSWFYSPLEQNGRRMDHDLRPELARGTVEFTADAPMYMPLDRPLQPCAFLCVIDCTEQALCSGITLKVCHALKQALATLPETFVPKIGFLSYGNHSVHFWDLSADKPKMFIVPDTENIFTPLLRGVFVKHNDPKISSFLTKLPSLARLPKTKIQSSLGAALLAASTLLKPFGGRILVFHTSMPVSDPGALIDRGSLCLYGSDKEGALFKPQSSFYQDLGDQCAANKTSVTFFLFSNQYLDVASIKAASLHTGGRIYHYRDGYDSAWDERNLQADLQHCFTHTVGYDSMFKVCASPGILVDKYTGHLKLSPNNNVSIATVDTDTTLLIYLKHDTGGLAVQEAVLQSSLLYTTTDGMRRIRVHTLSLPVVADHSRVFSSADVDAIVFCHANRAVDIVYHGKPSKAKDSVFDSCVDIAAAYHKYCFPQRACIEFVLPDSLRLLPLLSLALTKSPLLLPSKPTDMKCTRASILSSVPISSAIASIYPIVYLLPVGAVSEKSRNPEALRLSAGAISTSSGLYILYNGMHLVVYATNIEDLSTLYGVEITPTTPADELCSLFWKSASNPDSPAFSALQALLSLHGHNQLALHVLHNQLPGFNTHLAANFHEDKGPYDNPSLSDWLRLLKTFLHTKLLW